MKNLALVLSLSVLASCGGSKGGKSGLNAEKFRGISNLEVDKKETYISDCQKLKSDGETTYKMSMFEVEMQDAHYAKFAVADVMFTENCEVPLLETMIEGHGTFQNNNTLFKAEADDIYFQPLLDEVTDALNASSVCGVYDWETGVRKNLTHSNCVEGSLSSDFYIDSKDNGSNLVMYMCEENTPLNNKCEKMTLRKALVMPDAFRKI